MAPLVRPLSIPRLGRRSRLFTTTEYCRAPNNRLPRCTEVAWAVSRTKRSAAPTLILCSQQLPEAVELFGVVLVLGIFAHRQLHQLRGIFAAAAQIADFGRGVE